MIGLLSDKQLELSELRTILANQFVKSKKLTLLSDLYMKTFREKINESMESLTKEYKKLQEEETKKSNQTS